MLVSSGRHRIIWPFRKRKTGLGRLRLRAGRLTTVGVKMLLHEASGVMTVMTHMVSVNIEVLLPREEAVGLHGRATGRLRDRF